MSILQPKKIQDLVILGLAQGSRKTTDLLSDIRQDRPSITKQAFYAVLRALKCEEAVVVYKGVVALNSAWIETMREWFEQISRTYTLPTGSPDILSLEERESVSYLFSTTRHLDIFWGHSQNILLRHSAFEPIYSYDPHYWFYIARRETEQRLLQEIMKNKKQFLMTVGGTSTLDKLIKKDFATDRLQYALKRLFDRPNYYVTVIGDFITEVFLDPKIAQQIENLYQQHRTLNSAVMEKFLRLLETKGKNRIRISKNTKRAQGLKAKLGKNFYVLKKPPVFSEKSERSADFDFTNKNTRNDSGVFVKR